MKKLSLLLLAAVVFFTGAGVYANAKEPGRDTPGQREAVEGNRYGRGHGRRHGRGGAWFNFNYRPRQLRNYGYYYVPPAPYYYPVPGRPYAYTVPARPYYGGTVIIR